jgi:hypothetical protein
MRNLNKLLHEKFEHMTRGRGNPLHTSIRHANAIHVGEKELKRIENEEKNLIRKASKY